MVDSQQNLVQPLRSTSESRIAIAAIGKKHTHLEEEEFFHRVYPSTEEQPFILHRASITRGLKKESRKYASAGEEVETTVKRRK